MIICDCCGFEVENFEANDGSEYGYDVICNHCLAGLEYEDEILLVEILERREDLKI